VEELAPFPVCAEANLGVVELRAQSSHVVAGHVFFLLQLALTVGETAIGPKLAFVVQQYIFAHLGFLLALHVLVEIVPLLVRGELALLLFASGFTEFLLHHVAAVYWALV